jgi:hypothetical protein
LGERVRVRGCLQQSPSPVSSPLKGNGIKLRGAMVPRLRGG